MSAASDSDASSMSDTSVVDSDDPRTSNRRICFDLKVKIGASLELHIHGVDTEVKVQQTGDQFHIEVKPQHSGEGKAGASNKRSACTVIQMRPAKRLETSPLQAQQSSDANMANSTGEREERPRMYKKTRVVRSSNTEKEETEEGETEESEEARQLEVEMGRQWEDTCV